MDKKETILVCGGSGYIGSSFTAFILQGNRYDVVIVDNLSNGWHINTAVKAFYKADIGDEKMMREIIRKHNITVVLHFCAFLEVGESVKDPLKYYDNNIGNSVKLLRACIAERCFKFIFSSTAAVYGEPEYTPIDEKHALNPINPYGRSKLYFENILSDLSKAEKEFRYVALRYFNVAGALTGQTTGEAHEPESHLIPNILNAVLNNRKTFKIFGTDYKTKDGTCVRDYIHMEDLCKAHEDAMDYLSKGKESNVFNLGSGGGYSIREVLEVVRKVTKKDFKVEDSDRREGDPAILVASNEKAKNELNWSPGKTLEDIIGSAYEWHQRKDETVKRYRVFKEVDLFNEFQQKYGSCSMQELGLFYAPGRLNFIGEHTDYNGGWVLPCSVNKGTYMMARLNNTKTINVYSYNFKESISFDLSTQLEDQKKDDWGEFFRGALIMLNRLETLDQGLDIYVYSNMPMGSGMSSSSSFTIACLLTVNEMIRPKRKIDTVKLAIQVEREIIGTMCGIMDQFVIVNGEANSFIHLNCKTEEYSLVDADLGPNCLLIVNTNYKRQLKDSKYNERVNECKAALEKLQSYKKAETLSEYTVSDLEMIEKVLDDDLLFRRAKHVITENDRVVRTINGLKTKDYKELGLLLNQSHESLRNDYEVTGPHLDSLAHGLQACEGVFGARMMGAGFGGCVISLVHRDCVNRIIPSIKATYQHETQLNCDCYIFTTEKGASRIDI